MASTDQVYMQVKNTLTRARPNVQHGAVSILDAAFARKFGGDEVTIANIIRIFRFRFFQAPNVPLRNDQDMGRRLRVDVFEGKSALVLVNLPGRRLSPDDSAEQTTRLVVGHEDQFLVFGLLFQGGTDLAAN